MLSDEEINAIYETHQWTVADGWMYERAIIAAAPAPQAQQERKGQSGETHSRVRAVLKHHGLTKDGDGVVESDIIEAVLGAAPAPHPDTRTVVQQMVDALEDVNRWRNTGIGRPPEQTSMAAITAGQKLLKELK